MAAEVFSRITRRRERLGLPHDRYAAAGASFVKVKEHHRYVIRLAHVDVLEAVRRNHELVRQAAAVAGIEPFVVNAPVDGAVVLGIDAAHAASMLDALRALAGNQPIYVRGKGTGDERWSGIGYEKLRRRSPERLSYLDVYCHYREPSTGQNFGARQACRMEVWRTDEAGDLRAPTLNGRAGSIAAADQVTRVTVDVHGEREPTFAPLARRSVLEVDFPIDVVYLWVDGQDPDWQARKATRLAELTGSPPQAESLTSVRFDQGDELRHSLRSVHRYAPWVRRIFLVTDRQRPAWLVERPGDLDVVDHRDIMEAEHLPTFNSHAISAAVHRIPDLSERFIIVNDDVLLGRPVPPEAFFLSNGVARFFPSRSALPATPPREDDPPLVVARRRSQQLIADVTGMRPNVGFKHTPIAFRREFVEELERTVPEWTTTLASPFRSSSDIVPEWLHHYLGYHRGLCLPSEIDYAYFDIGSQEAVRQLRGTVYRAERPSVLCVNDVTDASIEGADRHAALNTVLEGMYPHRSPYEAEMPDGGAAA